MEGKPGPQKPERGSSPASRGGAGTYVEGELGALYLLALLTGNPAVGLPAAVVTSVRFQGTEHGFALDDLIISAAGVAGAALLEIQSKRDATFAPRDPVFAEVAAQIAKTSPADVPAERHLLGIAVERTSRQISGSYQDVLRWARDAESAEAFFRRVAAKGVGSTDKRTFVETTRRHLVANGIKDGDDAIWRILRRMLILEFDFEAKASLARSYGIALARNALGHADESRAEAIWSKLVDLSLATATTGGQVDRTGLRSRLADAGFQLAGDRDYASARARLAETAALTLAGIGTKVAGVTLDRAEAVGALDAALAANRFVEIRGAPGVGKSWALRNLAERVARHSPVIVLDPVATPAGGWLAFAQAFGIPGTAFAFLSDYAASGGATLFIDGLDMFVDPAVQRTVGELLRTAASIPGFAVVATSRAVDDAGGDRWLDDEIVATFGGKHPVNVGNLSDAEVQSLVEQAPELRALLDPAHPATELARNLYRLSRLLKVESATEIRTEAALAQLWWQKADGAPADTIRPAQRILADLAARALQGEDGIDLASDPAGRSHLLGSLTLKEIRRDRLDFYHDVLRDWAIGSYIAEDPSRLEGLNLTLPVSPRLARGIEFAGRIALENAADCSTWRDLLGRLSPPGAHGSWRRQALLALVRSEAGSELLEKCAAALLADGGALFGELVTAIVAVETVATVDLMTMPDGAKFGLPRSHRTDVTGSALRALRWALGNAAQIPLPSISPVVELVNSLLMVIKHLPRFATPVVAMLFNWLRQLDIRAATVSIPGGYAAGRAAGDERRLMVGKLRTTALLLGEHAPEAMKTYLNDVAAENDHYKVKEIRPFSQVIAPVAPSELAAVIRGSLIERPERRCNPRDRLNGAFTFADSDYLPPSPAQPPFLPLLEASPQDGLALIRGLVAEVIEFNTGGRDPGDNGFEVEIDGRARFFPWRRSLLWSRDHVHEHAAASGLMALEAWSQRRLDDGEPVETVLPDILEPDGGCAAFLQIAIDVLLSHFGVGRDALGPFLADPELLAADRQRVTEDQMNIGRTGFGLQDEPAGKVRLQDLRGRPSRRVSLFDAVPSYLRNDPVGNALREKLGAAVGRLEPYDEHSSWVDPRFLARSVLNMLDRTNWLEREDGNLAYHPPAAEAAHLAQMADRHENSVSSMGSEARVSLALEGGEHATAETAGMAAEYAAGGLPDDSDTDALKSRSTRIISTALLVARDGDDALLEERQDWVRRVIEIGLREKSDRGGGSADTLRFNRPAIATLALIQLWARQGAKDDRDALVRLATRDDRIAAPAFSGGLARILETDPNLLKAAMRAAFASMTWRWRRHDGEPDPEQAAFAEARSAAVERAIEAEIAWLDGGIEPAWPQWPRERPLLRRAPRMRVPTTGGDASEASDGEDQAAKASVEPTDEHVDSKSAAQWLKMIEAGPKGVIGWRQEVATAYLDWTMRLNGHGLPADAGIYRAPMEWNSQYFVLFAERLLDAPQARLDADLALVSGLPDDPFCNVAPSIIQAADALYFNDPARAAARPVALRSALVARVMTLERWVFADDPASPRVDSESAGVVAKALLNNHNPFSRTQSYLPPLLFDRVDPLLDALRPMLPGGPTSFVALCTMNLLLVAPRARHLDFLLDAAEAWFGRTQAPRLWIATGIGHKVVTWLEAAIVEEPGILAPTHPARERIDRVLGQLVSAGVAEAHEMELKVQAAAAVAPKGP